MTKKIKMTKENLAKRVTAYLKRAKRDRLVPDYKTNEKGFYEIIGGSSGTGGPYDSGRKGIPGVYKGRYIDVVAEAVQMYSFYGDWCNTDDPGNCNHGKVVKYNQTPIINVPVEKGLVKLVNMFQGFQKEEKELEKKLAKVKETIGE